MVRQASALGLFALFGLGCSASDRAPPGRSESAVIGGVAETGYTSVGYLRDNEHGEVICGVTLLAPDVAVTAAHCIEPGAAPARYAAGFGAIVDGDLHPVSEAIRHPDYEPGEYESGSPHDVAVLRLAAPVAGRAPATVASANVDCDHRYVGYGRTSPGGMWSLHQESGDRKSAKTCVRRQTDLELHVRGVDGGNCWGDSGGPLMVEGPNDRQNRIVAVMSRFEPVSPLDEYLCEVGNRMIMIRLDAHESFLAAYAPDAFVSVPSRPR